LSASYNGDLNTVKQLTAIEPDLAYAQYNYLPPIHLAVREGREAIVDYLLKEGAYDPSYKTYPFLESLVTLASDRGYIEIEKKLLLYAGQPSKQRFRGDNGGIHYPRTTLQQEFEDAVDQNKLAEVERILKAHPEFVHDLTWFWGEGILMMPAKTPDIAMLDLLLSYGATVPPVLKWTQAYYFKSYRGAAYMMEKGMNPDTMSCHQVTILHDMAQKGFVDKAKLLLNYGASIDLIDEEYQSTPLGIASRWGQLEMVKILLENGADPNKSGAHWSTPLTWSIKKGYPEITDILKNAGAIR
jgi:ankyrin repeat protein